MTEVHIQGLGTYAPPQRISNVDLMSRVDTNDEWIVTRTGIKARHMLADDENGADAGEKAARIALEEAGVLPEELTHVLVATCSPDYLCPSTACILGGKLGAIGAMSLDFNAACSGFVYGLDLAASILAATPQAKILLVCTEAMTRRMNWQDRTTCILFGDGAGAIVLGATPRPQTTLLPSSPLLEDVICHADGRQHALLTIGGGTARAYQPGDTVGEDFFLQMQGREVFKLAVRNLTAVCHEVLDRNTLSLDDVDLFIPHQANLRIVEAVGDRLALTGDKVFVNLDEYGNTSAASIPLALGDACAQGRIKPGMRVLFSTFGGGFTWGAALFRF